MTPCTRYSQQLDGQGIFYYLPQVKKQAAESFF